MYPDLPNPTISVMSLVCTVFLIYCCMLFTVGLTAKLEFLGYLSRDRLKTIFLYQVDHTYASLGLC